MAHFKKTKILVASGIAVCLLGLAFIAGSGNEARSSGYDSILKLGSLIDGDANMGHCVALKGQANCVSSSRL